MALRVSHHLSAGGITNIGHGSWGTKLYSATQALFGTAVNSMAGISGYFGMTSRRFNLSRIFTLSAEVHLYVFVGCQIGFAMDWIDSADFYWR
jgi:hypothetical protein